jgi:hypothetical protein
MMGDCQNRDCQAGERDDRRFEKTGALPGDALRRGVYGVGGVGHTPLLPSDLNGEQDNPVVGEANVT